MKNIIAATNESANPWILYSGESLSALVDLFTKEQQHRCLVIDEEILQNSIKSPVPASASLSLVSQTDLLRYIHASKSGNTRFAANLVEPLLDTPVTSLPSLGGPKAIMAMLVCCKKNYLIFRTLNLLFTALEPCLLIDYKEFL